ncbi:FUSC family protein [Fuerstiella marisgermanici]|uniref:Multidrug efflux system protein MdtO n=1 Tax=Fuerstiella marisgermanici TaxID=1891926 RepID=A0A1P8WC09_9PLAN|nr:FUSC family protein [Fuerstiella marisgermanici]APZ91574.1 multidrug efflux system protein MdtO [Fuerstiella marisgermanici]
MNAEPTPNTLSLRNAFKVALSLTLCYWFTLAFDWQLTVYGAYAIIFCSLETSGSSIEKGLMRFVGTCIGIVIGIAMLSMFAHDRWQFMVAMAVYLGAIGYGIQTSRYTYAWYVGGFLPLVLWSSNYPTFDNTFTFSVYRWLETVAGIVIYSIVDVVIWPRSSGHQLKMTAAPMWSNIAKLFSDCRDKLGQSENVDITGLRAEIASAYAIADFDLQQAMLDTPAVRHHRAAWKALRINGRSLVNHLDIWHEAAVDCRELPLQQVLPKLNKELDRVADRFRQIQSLWSEVLDDSLPLDSQPSDVQEIDRQPLAPAELELNVAELAKLPITQRAAIHNFVEHLKLLDRDADRVVRNLRIICGLDAINHQQLLPHVDASEVLTPSIWSVDRFLIGLFPVLVWISTFLFWIYFHPPTGTAQVQMTATLALMLIRERTSPIVLGIAILIVLFLIVAPVTWLVMPAFNTGAELLAFIFAYAFVFTYLGGKNSALKIIPLVVFATVASISNSQHFSFQGNVNAGLMFLLAVPFLTVFWYLLTPMRPEQGLLRTLSRFYRGCSRVCDGFFTGDAETRKRDLEMFVLPASGEIRHWQTDLKKGSHSENSPELVQSLLVTVQGISSQLVAMQQSHRRALSHANEIPKPLHDLAGRINREFQSVFDRWAKFDSETESESLGPLVAQLENEINQRGTATLIDEASGATDASETPAESKATVEPLSELALQDFHVLLGNLRGLVHAVARCDSVVRQINWAGWTASRF